MSVPGLQARIKIGLPALLGMELVEVSEGSLIMRLPLTAQLMAPNGYLHAGSVVALADTACGFACWAHMPEGALNFTTIELKSNFLGTAKQGVVQAQARAVHCGRTTQVWDAAVSHVESGRAIAVFRCTQLILWPRADEKQA